VEYRRPSVPRPQQTLDGMLAYDRRAVTYEHRIVRATPMPTSIPIDSPKAVRETKPPLPTQVKQDSPTPTAPSVSHATLNRPSRKAPMAFDVHTPKRSAMDFTTPSKPVHRASKEAITSKSSSPVTTTDTKPLVQNSEATTRPRKHTDAPKVSIAKRSLLALRRQKPGVLVLYAAAALLFIAGIVVSLNGFRTNHQIAAQVKQTQKSDSTSASVEGAAPSTVKPSTNSIASYAVSPNLPRYIDIAKLGVHARVLSMGVNSKSQLQAPGNVYDAGWYNASAQPGQPGAMLVDGHVSSWTTKGVFYGLGKLSAGDPIVITRGDGQKFTYTVVKSELDDADKVDMSSLLVSQNTAKPGLSLISCAGDVIAGTNEFNKRQVVYAVMQ
jgi:sortase (surface protein transpeptidase)